METADLILQDKKLKESVLNSQETINVPKLLTDMSSVELAEALILDY